MIRIQWTSKALSDLLRLYEFLAKVNKPAAALVMRSLTTAPDRLKGQPRIGERLEEFDPREVRRMVVGRYELRYEIQQSTIIVLRLWHTRESRK
jgi:plasmid stabilization system protein ParE